LSYYTERWILIGEEGTWGTWKTPDTFPTYLLSWDATTTEHRAEEEVIGGDRDSRSRVWLHREVVARWEEQLVSSKVFYLALGSHSTGDTASPYRHTISPASTVPSLSIYRGLTPTYTGESATLSLGYMGMKVDTCELNFEAGEDVTVELNFAGKDTTIPTALGKPDIDFSIEPFTYSHCSVDVITPNGTVNVSHLRRGNITIDNNLEAKVTSGSGSYKPVEIRERGLRVSGRLVVFAPLGTLSSVILNRNECTLKVYMIGDDANMGTIEITVNNIVFDELSDELRGLEQVEMELPFSAKPSTGGDVIQIVHTTAYSWNNMPW